MLTAKKLGSFLSLSNLLVTPVIQNTSGKRTFLRNSSIPTLSGIFLLFSLKGGEGRTAGRKEGQLGRKEGQTAGREEERNPWTQLLCCFQTRDWCHKPPKVEDLPLYVPRRMQRYAYIVIALFVMCGSLLHKSSEKQCLIDWKLALKSILYDTSSFQKSMQWKY